MPNKRHVVVLLRGVNVGRAKRISMADFAQILADLGATDIHTVLNSGNAVCTTSISETDLATAVSAEIETRLGFSTEVITRTQSQLSAMIKRNPLRSICSDESRQLVIFLRSKPATANVKVFDALDLGPDAWELEGRDLHAWLPDGVAESRLIKALNKDVLHVSWTARNWATVQKLNNLSI